MIPFQAGAKCPGQRRRMPARRLAPAPGPCLGDGATESAMSAARRGRTNSADAARRRAHPDGSLLVDGSTGVHVDESGVHSDSCPCRLVYPPFGSCFGGDPVRRTHRHLIGVSCNSPHDKTVPPRLAERSRRQIQPVRVGHAPLVGHAMFGHQFGDLLSGNKLIPAAGLQPGDRRGC